MRTWDENRNAINQLWPLMTFTDEEKRLWHDDLSGLDQSVLYDAIRNVKRNNDTNYPQLKWVRDEFRLLDRLRKIEQRPKQEPRVTVQIDKREDEKLRDELREYIDSVTRAEWKQAVDLVADKAATLKIELATGYRLVRYLNKRLGMENGGVIA